VQTDARGAVFQLKDTFTNRGLAMNDDGTYKGNVVADMQIFVAQAIHEDIFPDDDPVLQTAVNTVGFSALLKSTISCCLNCSGFAFLR